MNPIDCLYSFLKKNPNIYDSKPSTKIITKILKIRNILYLQSGMNHLFTFWLKILKRFDEIKIIRANRFFNFELKFNNI